MFIDDLRAARRGKGFTRAALAECIGVTEQTIKRLEQGTGSTATLVAAMATLDFHLNGIGRGATLLQQINARIGKLGWSPALVAKRAGLKRPTVLAVMEGTASMASTLSVLAAVAPNIRRASPARVHWSPDRLGERDSRFTPPHYLNAVVDASVKSISIRALTCCRLLWQNAASFCRRTIGSIVECAARLCESAIFGSAQMDQSCRRRVRTARKRDDRHAVSRANRLGYVAGPGRRQGSRWPHEWPIEIWRAARRPGECYALLPHDHHMGWITRSVGAIRREGAVHMDQMRTAPSSSSGQNAANDQFI